MEAGKAAETKSTGAAGCEACGPLTGSRLRKVDWHLVNNILQWRGLGVNAPSLEQTMLIYMLEQVALFTYPIV